MSRSARMLRSEKPTVYHVISRTTLPGLPLSDADKDQLVHLLQKFAAMFFVDVLGYCMMGNHIHLALRVQPESLGELELGTGELLTSAQLVRKNYLAPHSLRSSSL